MALESHHWSAVSLQLLHCIMGESDANRRPYWKSLLAKILQRSGLKLLVRMFSSKCISPGFSRFLSASTIHVAHSLKGAPAVVIPVVETVQSPPATLTNHSISKLVPTGNLVATTKHFGKKIICFIHSFFEVLDQSYVKILVFSLVGLF